MSIAGNHEKIIMAGQVKLPNRRVKGALMMDGTISFQFSRLMPDRTINRDHIRLTPEAVMAMFKIMTEFDAKINRGGA